MSIGSPTADEIEAFDAFKLALLRDIKKVRPATVDSFRVDPARGALITARPVRQLLDESGHVEDPKPVPNVPVVYMSIGGLSVAGRLPKGQPVLLLIADHQLAGWIDGKASQRPVGFDAPHSMAGALAIPMQGLGAGSMAGLGAGLTIGKPDGSLSVRIEDGLTPTVEVEGASIKLGGSAVEPAAMGASLVAALATFAGAIGTTPTLPGIVAAAAALLTALQIPAGSPASPLAVKTKVE